MADPFERRRDERRKQIARHICGPACKPSCDIGQSARPPLPELALRHQHYDEILSGNPPIDWFEVISENYMLPGGQPLRTLDRFASAILW